jgi:hypothetical protein
LYLDAWYYLDAVSPYSRNHKLFRIITGTTSGGGWGQPNLYYNLYCGAVGATSHLSQDGVDTGNFHFWLDVGVAYFSRKWTHVQGYFKQSSANADDGTAMLWLDGTLKVNQVNNFRTRTSSTTWSTIWLGHFLAHESDTQCGTYGDAYTYWDDVYMDTTQARVEIGNASTYATSLHREIQIPSTWSSSSINVKLNKGSFSSFDNLYLYVTDTSGRVNSSGFQICATCNGLKPPTNLRIVR